MRVSVSSGRLARTMLVSAGLALGAFGCNDVLYIGGAAEEPLFVDAASSRPAADGGGRDAPHGIEFDTSISLDSGPSHNASCESPTPCPNGYWAGVLKLVDEPPSEPTQTVRWRWTDGEYVEQPTQPDNTPSTLPKWKDCALCGGTLSVRTCPSAGEARSCLSLYFDTRGVTGTVWDDAGVAHALTRVDGEVLAERAAKRTPVVHGKLSLAAEGVPSGTTLDVEFSLLVVPEGPMITL